MKRITLLAVLAVVMTIVAIPAMAATTFAWSGEITSTFQTNFKTAAEGVATANVSLGVTINDNLSFTGLIITTANTVAGGTGALTNTNGAYDATVQVGKIMGMDPKTFGEAITIGNFATGATTYGVSGYGNEAVFGAGMTSGALSIASVTTISNMINVYLGVDPASFIGGGTAQWLADVYGTLGPVNVSLGYGSNMQQGLNVSFSQAMGDLTIAAALGETYDLSAGSPKGYTIGVGAKVAYKTLLTAGLGLTYGGNPAGLGTVDINVNLAPAANYGVDVWTVLDTANGIFGGAGYLDLSAWTKLDASTLRVGYVYTSGTGNVGEYVARTNGGLYLDYDLTF